MLLWEINSFAATSHRAKDSGYDEAQQHVEEQAAQVVLHDEGTQVGHPAPSAILEHLIGGQHMLLPVPLDRAGVQ